MGNNKPDASSEAYRVSLGRSLKWDAELEEAYLQLPSFPTLRLVPFHEGIEDDLVALFNHPVVGQRLFRLPYPMPRSFAEERVSSTLPTHRDLLSQLASRLPSPVPTETPLLSSSLVPPGETQAGKRIHIPGCPFKSLIDVSTGQIVGDINLGPHVDKADMTPEDVLRLPNKEQEWVLGYVLDPAYHGRGVMSEMVGCLIEGWARNWMDIKAIIAHVEDNNPGSIRVVLKNGLVLVEKENMEWPEAKGGGIRPGGKYERKML